MIVLSSATLSLVFKGLIGLGLVTYAANRIMRRKSKKQKNKKNLREYLFDQHLSDPNIKQEDRVTFARAIFLRGKSGGM